MKQSKKLTKKDREKSKKISNIALIVFFISYVIPYPFMPLFDKIMVSIGFYNARSINRYIGLGISIYGYLKYKNSKYSRNVMIICIILQVLSILILLFILYVFYYGDWGQMG